MQTRSDFYKTHSALVITEKETNWRQDLEIYYDIIRHAWVYLLATLLNFTTTLIVFPAVLSLIEPSDPSLVIAGLDKWVF